MNLFEMFGNSEPNCTNCGRRTSCKSPKMSYYGSGNKKVLIIGESPTRIDDENNIPLMGKSGEIIRAGLSRYGFDIDQDAWRINAVNCWQSGTTKPTSKQIQACWPYVKSIIDELKPNFIWAFGSCAIESIHEYCFKKTLTIEGWRDHCIFDHKLNAYVVPMFHPTYIAQNENDLNLQAVFNLDLYNAVKYLLRKPKKSLEYDFHLLTDFDEIVHELTGVLEWEDEVYFDYETTGLKPFRSGHKIVAIAYTTNGYNCYAFPLDYRDHFNENQIKRIKHIWKQILENNRIQKSAHNLKFEDTWSRVIIGANNIQWAWDSMIAAHILDCRKKQSGLKIQAYIQFGDRPYNENIEPFLKSKESHMLNNVMQIPLEELLEYNAKDVLYGFNLMGYQKAKILPNKNYSRAYQLFHDGILAFSDMQMNGIHVDEKFYYEEDKKLEKLINDLDEKLRNSEESRNFFNKTGEILDYNSPKDLGVLLYDIMKLPKTFTDKGNYKVDKDVLSEFDVPFVKTILEKRKLEKVKNTYIAQITREICDDKINPFFDLHIPVSFRSSSSAPNFQNFPKHDPLTQKIVRGGIFPSPGNQLLECDFSGAEVRVACCYHQDKNMINYILDESTDMHRDTAMDIFKLPIEEVTKDIRYLAKGQWVFAQFYGSWYRQCAMNIWKVDLPTNTGVMIKDHLIKHGIKNYDDFENHCQKVERKFWDERFPEYKQWKLQQEQFFRSHGYIDFYTGFRCAGALSKNEIANYSIQGSSFHCLLWTLTEVNKIAKAEKWKSKIIGQIHDSIVFDLYPPEKDIVIETVDRVGTKEIEKAFSWLIVPMKMEFEIAGINEPWYNMKEIKK